MKVAAGDAGDARRDITIVKTRPRPKMTLVRTLVFGTETSLRTAAHYGLCSIRTKPTFYGRSAVCTSES